MSRLLLIPMAVALLAVLLVVLRGEARVSGPAASPVVVELFTSQGCDSCPPADAFLRELIRTRPEVLGLTFHVDYWNNLNWVDPYSSSWASARQRHYAAQFHRSDVYTPQAVIDGYLQAIGSSQRNLLAQIEKAQVEGRADHVEIQTQRTGGNVTIDVGAGTGRAVIWQIGFDATHTTQIPSGENQGRTLTEAHIVRSLREAGEWQGKPVHLTVPAAGGESTAVLVQREDGHILGAGVATVVP